MTPKSGPRFSDQVTRKKRLLVVSNGHGEDSIAAEIIRRLPPTIAADAYPTLGEGRAFAGVCTIVGPRRSLPSEGHRLAGSLLRDARAGFGIGPAMRFMRNEAKKYDKILVVGDMLGVVMCWLSGNRTAVYLDVYKSGYGNAYSAAERWLLRHTTDLVLSRDDVLAGRLRHAGVNARFAGSAMMDTLVMGSYDAAARRRNPVAITVLPGSRAHNVENFKLQLAALRLLPEIAQIDLFMPLARAEDAARLASATGLQNTGDTLTDGRITINWAAGSLGAMLAASDIVLGQAGTANLQAIGLGKPVVSFVAPSTTARRYLRNRAFYGDSAILAIPTPEDMAKALRELLDDPVGRARRGAIGRDRMGPPGAVDAIIAALA